MKRNWNVSFGVPRGIFLVFLLVFLSISTMNCNNIGEIPILELDENGNPTQKLAPKEEYSRRFEALAKSVHDSALPVLVDHDQNHKARLRTLVIGVGAEADVGIGPFKIGAYPRFRMLFCNSRDITVP